MIRIYATQETNIAIIEGVAEGPRDSFVVELSTGLISILRKSSELYEVKDLPYQEIATEAGTTFAFAADTLNYLEDVFTPKIGLDGGFF